MTLRGRVAIKLGGALLLLSLVSGAIQAQTNVASLSGQVLDQSSAAIRGATVTLRQTRTTYERTTTTDQNGSFHFAGIPQTEYRLTASEEGFAPFTTTVSITSPGHRDLNVVLQPGPIAESVVITSNQFAALPEVTRRIPGSIEVIDSQTLENSRAFNSTEVLRKVSGLNVRDEEGFGLRPNIGIRGINPTRSNKVLLLEDGIPLTYAPYGDNASYYHPPIDRFESIEVLKGSGQILYGPQTIAGVINYITPKPPDEPEGSILLIGGNRRYFNGNFTYGGTVGNTGLLFGYTRKQGDGSRENVHSKLNDFNFKSLSSLNAENAITIKFNYYDEDSNVGYSGLREDEFRANPRQNPFHNDFFFGDRYGASLTHAYVITPDVVLTTNFYGAYFRRHWWRQSSNSNQRPNDASDPLCGGMANLNTTCGNQGRLRRYYFAGLEPRLSITHGLFGVRNETETGFRMHFENQARVQKNGDRPDARDGVIVENNGRRNQAYSGFIQNRFLIGNLTVTPGFRLEHVKYQRSNRLLGVTGKTTVTQAVPGLGVAYTLKERVTLFAGVHRGFAPPRTEDIINNTTGGSVDLDSELSWNYEVGMRGRPHRSLRLDATFFRLDYENQIIPASLAGGIGSIVTNGGATLHQGLELTASFDSAAILKRRFNVYLRTAYTYLPVAEFRGNRFSGVPGFSTTRITGNRLPYAPEHLLNASVGYAHSGGLDLFVEGVYAGSQFSEDLNLINPLNASGQTGLIPSYTIFNATANYSVERLRTTFFITAKNLFDRLYIADRARGILPGPPRGIHAGFKYRF